MVFVAQCGRVQPRGGRVSPTAEYDRRRGSRGIQSFPTLTLEQVYGAITYYLSHRAEIDAYLAQEEIEFEKMRKEAREAYPLLYRKLEAAKNRTPVI